MSSLLGLLHSGAAALLANQTGTAVHGNNLANARTPGYARRGVLIDEGYGHGVHIKGVERAQDFVLSQKLTAQGGDLAGKALLLGGLQDLEQAIVAGRNSLSQQVTDLGRSFSEAAAHPSDQIRRSDALVKGQAVTTEMMRLSQTLKDTQQSARSSALGFLPQINSLAQNIASLNQKVKMGAGGAMAPDMAEYARSTDERDQAVKALVEIVGGKLLRNEDGGLDVVVGGLALVHGDVASSLDLADSGGALQVKVGGAQAQLPVGGKLGGTLLLMESATQHLGQFDRLAFDLAAVINAQHSLGVGLDGAGGRPFFQPIGAVAGAAAKLKLDVGLSATTLAVGLSAQPGDNRNALALASLIEQPVLEGGRSTIRSVYSRIVSQLGQDVQRTEGDRNTSKSQKEALDATREALMGVSTDEEMTRILAYQRGFEASARFIKVIDEMLQQVIQLP